jgi:hypothetical protein
MVESDNTDRASVPIDGTKIRLALEGSRQVTVEVVSDIVVANPGGGRLSHIGSGTEAGRISLRTPGPGDDLIVRMNNRTHGQWGVNLESAGRCVWHLVIDTSDMDEASRVRLYWNGVSVANDGAVPGWQEQISIGDGRSYVIGNRENGNRNNQGTIFYAAMYTVALTPAEIETNASRLFVDDDR